MYMAFGWPQVIPLESTAAAATSSSPSFDRIVYLKVINRHLLVVSPTHLELWSSSQHKVRLGKYVRDADSVERHGENLQAIWSPDTKSIAVLILAVGCSRGVVELYDLAENATHLRTISLYDWGYSTIPMETLGKFRSRVSCEKMYSMEDTGPVTCISWTPDNCAFAVGWKFRGLTVWSASGCRLMCTIRQIGMSSASSPMVKPNQDLKFEPLVGGTSQVQWDEFGYKLYAIEERSSERILAFSFGKCCLNRGLSGTSFVRQIVYGEDRVLVVQPDDTDELKIVHLNLPSSLLYRKQLLGKPMVMDVFQDYILVTYRPFDVHIFHVKISGELSPSSSPVLQLSTVRELSIMTAKSHPASMRFIPDSTVEKALEKNNSFSLDILSQQPSRCLILRTNGELSVLDLDDGHEQLLSNSVELFWVTCGQSEKANLIEEVSWLDYGHRGMQVWYPSPGVDPFKREDFLQRDFLVVEVEPLTSSDWMVENALLDPELEFDREIYPLGLLPNIAVVRDKSEEALRLACLSAEKPHFSHCLEWLLFTVFDAEISRQNANKNQFSASVTPSSNSLLEKTCNLIKNFPEYVEVVVSVARKTDGRHWADLFSSAGRSTEYCRCPEEAVVGDSREQGINEADSGGVAVIVDKSSMEIFIDSVERLTQVIAKLEGPAVSQYCALRLLQATLDESLYELAGELEYLQRERQGSARLENFASGLQLIGQKLQMDTLQSRLDAEFLLAHMCSVKFKEWIVVLATLLRRAEVLVDLFRHDLRLWTAYSRTLQSHPSFHNYLDLLDVLEEQLASVSDLDIQNGPAASSDHSSE
ncbi:RIC1 [Musa troglodytarum]|uniref:RIC1 n=1 Tax=Musa troglodytarum TaxID=320322 RepID=A0A9E7F0H4_9LILI|nr:RIC1 [Musa troglodytarum]